MPACIQVPVLVIYALVFVIFYLSLQFIDCSYHLLVFVRIAYLVVPKLEKALLVVSRIENLGSGERNQKYIYYWKAKIITGKSQYIVSSVAMRSSIHSAAAQCRFGKVLFLIDEGLARDGSAGRRPRPRSTLWTKVGGF